MNMAKFVNHSLPEEGEIGVQDQRIRFIQNSDTWDHPGNCQYMTLQTIPVEFSEKDNTDSFIRMSIGDVQPDQIGQHSTSDDESDVVNFWSVDGPEDLIQIFNEFAKRTGMTCRWKIEKYYIAEE